ncbi:GIY-YIG domain-containing protein [Sphingomonas antarctica]|uniref:GIY-YIG nuclease family protein n=1 Tax=Sphingomonas antarctica TaxID=2040274 RepID=UPI0039E808B0
MTRGGYTYILTNKPMGILYVGVTADLSARLEQHRLGLGSKFVKKWQLRRLVHVETHDTIEEAIAREKALKEWQRLWKLRMISEANPNWDDLAESFVP